MQVSPIFDLTACLPHTSLVLKVHPELLTRLVGLPSARGTTTSERRAHQRKLALAISGPKQAVVQAHLYYDTLHELRSWWTILDLREHVVLSRTLPDICLRLITMLPLL
jgi:hypothetical protein